MYRLYLLLRGYRENDKETKTMKEKNIIQSIKAYLKTLENCFCFKTHGGYYGTAGIPDIVACVSGRFVAFEVKAEKGKTTPLQEKCLNQIREAGGVAEVVRSVAEVRAVIQNLTGGER